MLSQCGVTYALCLTAVSTQQPYYVCFCGAVSESDKFLVEIKLLCAKMVPKLLTQEQKAHRVNACQDILQQLEADDKLLEKVITGDELWIFQYDPETKRQVVSGKVFLRQDWRRPACSGCK